MNSKNSHRHILLLICVCLISVVEVYTNPTSQDLKSLNENSSGAVNSDLTNTTSENQQNEISTDSSDTSTNEPTENAPEPSDSSTELPANSTNSPQNGTAGDVPVSDNSNSSSSTILVVLSILALVVCVSGVGYVVYRKYYKRISYGMRYRSENVDSFEEESDRGRVHSF